MSTFQPILYKPSSLPSPKSLIKLLFTVVAIAGIGIAVIAGSFAGSPAITLEPEAGTMTPPATIATDSTASGRKASSFSALGGLSEFTLYFDSNRSGNYEVYKRTTAGTVTRLTKDSRYDSWWAKPSPNGKQVLFYRTPKGVNDTDYTKTSLWMMNSDGTNQRQIIANKANNWQYQGHAEWSPDGTRIVMFAGTNGLLIVHTNTFGGDIRLVNTHGHTLNTDPAWSPDGMRITYTFQGKVWVVPVLDLGIAPMQITTDATTDYDPYFSPDDTKIAYLEKVSDSPAPAGAWAINVVNKDGTDNRALINDGNVNSKPAWSPDGNYIHFHRHPAGSGSSAYFGLWFMNSDGSGLTALDVGPGNNEYPALVR